MLFLCQWELVYQFSEKFINFYFPLPFIFVVIFSRDFSGLYLLNQTSEVHETLPVLSLYQWELVYLFSEKFINFYYPLPIIFVVIFSWDLGGLHR